MCALTVGKNAPNFHVRSNRTKRVGRVFLLVESHFMNFARHDISLYSGEQTSDKRIQLQL